MVYCLKKVLHKSNYFDIFFAFYIFENVIVTVQFYQSLNFSRMVDVCYNYAPSVSTLIPIFNGHEFCSRLHFEVLKLHRKKISVQYDFKPQEESLEDAFFT